jgi:ABC-type transport system involved in multi-copper enzyme maturation permease subunit
VFHFTATSSSLYLIGLTAVALAISYAVFARRDVA